MPTIGIMHSGSNNRKHDDHIKAFKHGLTWAGYADGINVTILAPRLADNDPANLATIASALVNIDNVDVLVAAGGSASSQAAQAATATIPIVFTSAAEPTRPAANMTGICARTSELDAERLKLLHELLPGQTNFGALFNPSRFNYNAQKDNLNDAAAILGLEPLDAQDVNPRGGNAGALIDQAFQSWATDGCKGALVTADPVFNNHRNRVIAAAEANAIPAVYQWREFAEDGGLMSYGPNLAVAYTLAGIYVGRILGSTPAAPVVPKSLPILPLNKFELVINLKTAKALGLDIPATLLARANHIIAA